MIYLTLLLLKQSVLYIYTSIEIKLEYVKNSIELQEKLWYNKSDETSIKIVMQF